MVGLANEVHDTWAAERKRDVTSESEDLTHKYRSVKPSFIDMMSYYFCYIGLLTGT